ncbi:VOC family protein [Litorimonas haliclonae]|uniref:VOC family protein n=1 Tax=Litorimonas haliclonae TaxID=2081977 RepID=UPI0039F0A4DF
MTDKPALRFQRTNFVVADLEKSLTFYRDVLGFELAFSKPSESDSYSYDVFELPKKQMQFAVLSAPGQPRIMALTEIEGGLGYQEKERRSAIVLETPEIDRIVTESKALGLKVYHEDKLVTKDGREGREVGIADFDGNLVVLYLITKAAP